MKSVSKQICALLLISAAVITGCTKKPMRPDPNSTVLGPTGGGNGALNPESVPTNPEAAGLQMRDNGNFDESGQDRKSLEAQAVLFDFDKSNIKASERPKLQAAKDYLDKNAQVHLLLEGHCDWRGTAEYNLSLGDRRANEAKKYLIGLGVSADKLDTLSKGSEEAKKNADQETMAHDRRVDLVVTKPGAAAAMPAAGPAAAPATPAAP
jgi:peptidoglycan-associated lipoprotein